MKPVLVTGAAGFIGYHLSERLMREGRTVIGYDCLSDYYSVELKQARVKKLQEKSGFTFVKAELEDAAQKTFLVASTKLHLIAPECERAFLLATAANKAAHARRSRARKREVPEEEASLGALEDHRPLPDELLEQKRRRTLFYQILARMDTELQTVFVLFELEGMLTKDIATALNVPLGTVASRLRRAREEFTRMATRTMRQTSEAT